VIRVLLADDHPVVREGLRRLIEAERDMLVVGEAADAQSAWTAARLLAPDVVIMDVSMPGGGGVEGTRRVLADSPHVRVLALTVLDERVYVNQLLRAGASGYILKRSATSELVRAIRAVAGGATYIDPLVAGPLVETYLDHTHVSNGDGALLSEREREVLIYIARGFSNKEAAAALQISVKTVETYKARMANKLGLKNRVDIVRYAARQGWLDRVAAEKQGLS
jgi:DNA-binding NarL/FixJ family response regulator